MAPRIVSLLKHATGSHIFPKKHKTYQVPSVREKTEIHSVRLRLIWFAQPDLWASVIFELRLCNFNVDGLRNKV